MTSLANSHQVFGGLQREGSTVAPSDCGGAALALTEAMRYIRALADGRGPVGL